MFSSIKFTSITFLAYSWMEAVKTTDNGFFNLHCENFAEERWEAEESRVTSAGSSCKKFWSSFKKVVSVPCVCTMSEQEFRNLCAKVVKQRRFKRNYIPYRMDTDTRAIEDCRDYNIEFAIRRSARRRASVRPCPTVPQLYVADGSSAVFVFRPLSTGNIKLAHYLRY